MNIEIVITLNTGEMVYVNHDDVVNYHVVTEDAEVRPAWYEDVVHHLPEKKVMAIKAHRAATGMGLKESKAVVDGLCTQLHPTWVPSSGFNKGHYRR